MELTLVSIIAPTYNHGKFIGECIDSVLAQTYPAWEMIVISDGSTDDTLAIAQKYAATDDRIKVIHQENKGVFRLGETYNTALASASGKYIAILEGDDTWVDNKLESQVSILDRDPEIIMTWGQVAVVNHDLSETYYISPEVKNENQQLLNNIPTGSIIELTPMGIWIAPQTVLLRKSTLMSIGGFVQSHGMPLVDFSTFLRLSLMGRFEFENRVLGSWRMYSTQTTKKHTVEIYEGRKDYVRDHLPKVQYLNQEKAKKIFSFYEQACLEAYARSGRYKLLRCEFKSARKDYIKAITSPISGRMLWRLRALIGLVHGYLHKDVEWLAALLGKRTYRNVDGKD